MDNKSSSHAWPWSISCHSVLGVIFQLSLRFFLSFFFYPSHPKNNKPQPCTRTQTTLCPSVSSVDLTTPCFFPFVSDIFYSNFPFYLIKPWSRTGFIHSLRWPHPLLMTSAAKKHTPYLDFIY